MVKREVWGVAAQEVADKSGEIMDFATSKPEFEKWSAQIQKTSGGLSLGNVREMHGKSAAGKLTYFSANDEAKSFEVCAKVVDDAAWEKVQQGVYTGFSIGGSYAKRWADGNLTRYTASPSEVSLVDSPCIPTATFTMVKADGLTEQVEFIKIAERTDVKASEGKSKYGNVTFADEKNKKYPLDTEAHVRAAASYWGMPKNRSKYSAEDQKTISGKISAAEKKFGIGAKKMRGGELKKGMYGVSALANVISSLKYCAEDSKMEALYEKDESEVPGKLMEAVSMLGEILVEMAQEEVAELNPEKEDEMTEAEKMEMAELKKNYEALAKKMKEREEEEEGKKAKKGKEKEEETEEKGEKGKKEDEEKDDDEHTEKMVKMQKALDEALDRLAKVEAMPAAPSGAKPVVVALGKEADTRMGGMQKSTGNEALDLMKQAHANGKLLSKADLGDYLAVGSGARV